MQGVNVVNWPDVAPAGLFRLDVYAHALVRACRCTCATAGFVCYSRRALETIDLDAIG